MFLSPLGAPTLLDSLILRAHTSCAHAPCPPRLVAHYQSLTLNADADHTEDRCDGNVVLTRSRTETAAYSLRWTRGSSGMGCKGSAGAGNVGNVNTTATTSRIPTAADTLGIGAAAVDTDVDDVAVGVSLNADGKPACFDSFGDSKVRKRARPALGGGV
ncbi:hypothetical protein EXIGLDRAFT_31908 [Exidia glandulosa HHB12029]|uniref:Uncharacterized protein n=1 Tax=Exidia glandulosa HHB12029 TaxID=1314781 RepID=A0A165IUP9_EXIGL|nr:hypothetical protein EXIGLDRAFT_31908 [Exidia glandulosa HHB12029]